MNAKLIKIVMYLVLMRVLPVLPEYEFLKVAKCKLEVGCRILHKHARYLKCYSGQCRIRSTVIDWCK